MSKTRLVLRAGGVLAVAGVVALVSAPGASAHVTANVITAVQGSYAKITFRVPNEEDNAGTVKLQVTFPDSYPIPGASVKPVPGWKSQVDVEPLPAPVKENNSDVKKAVKTITWTADPGTRINPGEFQEFDVSAGPLPDDTDELQFPAVQTYDSGTVVNWTDQPAEAGQKDPEHPSPSIKLQTKANPPGVMDMSAMGTTGMTDTASSTAVSDNTARWLGGAGLLVGAIGVGFGAGAVLRNRRPATALAGSAPAASATKSGSTKAASSASSSSSADSTSTEEGGKSE
jgi:uncharacterized protein YcnI